MIDEKWMAAALSEALKCGQDVPVGCLAVKDGEVIGFGHNQRESHNDPTAHAEMQAIRQAAKTLGTWRLNDVTIYSTLEPCPMCAEAILQARVSRLVFGAYDLKSGAVGSAFNLYCDGRIYPIPEVVGGIMEGPCQSLLLDFFRTKTKRKAGPA